MDAPADMKDPKTWLALAEMKLDHARQIFEIGLFDDAVSRAYYAMFYAAKVHCFSKSWIYEDIRPPLQSFGSCSSSRVR